jgi:xanthine dehydrogenase accessory factor
MRSNPNFAPDAAPQSAFTSDDCLRILQFAADSFDEGLGAALVTLVEIRGGAARALGSQMAVRGDGLYCGFVSGGCTEAAIAAEAAEAIASGGDRFLKIGEGSRFFDIMLPCGGAITLSIHVLRDAKALRKSIGDLQARRRSGLHYNPATQSLHAAAAGETGWIDDCFLTAYRPRIRLILSGQSTELDMTSNLATAIGYDLVVATHCQERRPFDEGQIDADTAVALLHHDIDREIPILQAALAANPFYIGCLGSARTHGRRSNALRDLGHSDADIARIKAPIGIFGKARDAGSLALSVLADIAAARSGSSSQN